MITFIIVAGGGVLLVGLIALVYLASRRTKTDETGRKAAEQNQGPATPERTEGRAD